MAARKSVTVETGLPTGKPMIALADLMQAGQPQPNYDPGLLDDDPVDVSAEEALETALQQLGEDQANQARIIVHRLVDEGGRKTEEWLFETTPAEFATEGIGAIARQYGGGQYRVRVFISGRRGFLTQKVIRIANDLKKSDAPAPGADLVRVMADGFRQLGELIVAANRATAPDPAAQRMAMLNEMALMRDLFAAPAPAPAGNSMTESLGMLRELMALQRDLSPPVTADGNIDPMGVLMKGLEMFGKPMADALAKQQQAPMHSAQQLPAPVAVQARAPDPVQPIAAGGVYQPEPSEDQMNLFFKQAVNMLLAEAGKNSEPKALGKQIAEQAPDAVLSRLVDSPDWFSQVCAADSGAAVHQAWFESLHASILENLTE